MAPPSKLVQIGQKLGNNEIKLIKDKLMLFQVLIGEIYVNKRYDESVWECIMDNIIFSCITPSVGIIAYVGCYKKFMERILA